MSTLAGPATVNAAVNWSSEVRFPETGNTEDRAAFVSEFYVPSGPGGTCGNQYIATPSNPDATATTLSGFAFYDHTSNSYNGCYRNGGTSGARAMHFGWHTTTAYTSHATPPIGDGYPNAGAVTVIVTWNGYDVGSCDLQVFARNGYTGANVQTYLLAPDTGVQGSNSSGTWEHDFTAGTDWNHIVLQPGSCAYHTLTVTFRVDVEEGVGGNCYGEPGATGDGQLTWPSVALTSPTGADSWGHQWINEACRFTESEVVHFRPTAGIVAGDTYHFGIRAWSFDYRQAARISISWGGTGGPNGGVSAINWKTDSLEALENTEAYFVSLDAPAGASYFSISIGEQTMLGGLLIANVEGDPVLDSEGEYPSTDTGTIPPVPVDYWEDCSPPEDALNVPGWLEYGVCIVIGGFNFIGDLVEDAVTRMVAVWNDYLGPVFFDVGGALAGALTWFLGELLATLFAPLFAGLELLFAPSESVLDRWETVTATAETRFPFSAASSVFDGIAAGLSASPSGVIGTMNGVELAGQPIPLGNTVTAALGAVAPWRTLIFGGILILMVPRFVGVVFAAVGVANPARGDGGSSE